MAGSPRKLSLYKAPIHRCQYDTPGGFSFRHRYNLAPDVALKFWDDLRISLASDQATFGAKRHLTRLFPLLTSPPETTLQINPRIDPFFFHPGGNQQTTALFLLIDKRFLVN
jgi:hypothetical protein